MVEVIPNFDVELISPVATAAAATPWHLKAMGAPAGETGKDVLVGIHRRVRSAPEGHRETLGAWGSH